jgi:monoterpene epsilon-lactone hydrolase
MDDQGHLLPFPQAPDGIELRHLRAFVAVAEELSFARAADRLYVSSPALSRQIRGLEQLIGSDLLRRSTHRVELTIAGEALLQRARRLLRDVDEAVAATMQVGGELQSRIAKLWQPLEGLLGAAQLHEARTVIEEMQAQLEPPPGVDIRPVIAGGTPSLLARGAGAPLPTVLYVHGGGYVLSSAFGYRPHGAAVAIASGRTVLIPDYRLAPEHPFPASVEDCLSAYRWMLERGVSPSEITVVGDSSGGGLAMSTLLALRDRGGPMPAAAVLLCPWLDLRLKDEPGHGTTMVFTVDEWRRIAEMYLAGHPADDPVVNPLVADLTGLPPMLIQAATGDARLVDAKRLATRARAHGVEARLELFPVDAHAFHLFWSFLPEAADAIESAGAFIRSTVSARAGEAVDRTAG